MKEDHDFICLYISDKIYFNNSSLLFNHNIIHCLNDLIKKISHFNEFSFEIKIIIKNEFIDIIKEIKCGEKSFWNINIKDLETIILNSIHSNDDIIGIYFSIKNLNSNVHMKVIYLSSDYNNIIINLLSKFNEININKKRGDKSSKRKKGIKDITYILEQIKFVNGYYLASVIDIDEKEFAFSNSTIKEIILNF